jgi:protein tyrosine phosphatase (PTP) superfamily phosphohydrolase (DUF442 family)
MKKFARSMGSLIGALALVVVAGSVVSCSGGGGAAEAHAKTLTPIAMPLMSETAPRDYPGIHNAVAYHEGYVSGSVPEGDAGFETLAAMGVKTIISVDGAEPEVEKAAALGIKYIHLPIGYNGFDEKRKLELVRATRDAMSTGPVYIHCHHGKHRSAGAAAAVAASLGWMPPAEGVARMKVSGTAAEYKGLYAAASGASVLGANVIDAVPADFPSRAKPAGFVKGMVEIDEVFEHLKAIEKAGWRVPKDHPDLVPAAEAGRLADLYRAAGATDYARRKPSEFADLLNRSQTEAQGLEDLLAAGKADPASLAAQFKLVVASCKDCHVKYRD